MRLRGVGPGPWTPNAHDGSPYDNPLASDAVPVRPPAGIRDEYGFLSAAAEIAAMTPGQKDGERQGEDVS